MDVIYMYFEAIPLVIILNLFGISVAITTTVNSYPQQNFKYPLHLSTLPPTPGLNNNNNITYIFRWHSFIGGEISAQEKHFKSPFE